MANNPQKRPRQESKALIDPRAASFSRLQQYQAERQAVKALPAPNQEFDDNDRRLGAIFEKALQAAFVELKSIMDQPRRVIQDHFNSIFDDLFKHIPHRIDVEKIFKPIFFRICEYEKNSAKSRLTVLIMCGT